MNTSSQYPILDNRPIDQWKVTELKEELKKRKLVTKGLKEELIKRLDEALRDEEGAVTADMNNGVHESDHDDVADEADETESTVNGDGENEKVFSGAQHGSEDVNPHVDMKTSTSDITNQVSEVSISLGFSISSVSTVSEKNEVKDTIITDNVKLESSSELVLDGGESHPEDVDEPQENKVSVEITDNNAINEDMSRENHSEDLGSSEKLSLNRSSGDDALENKQTELKLKSEVSEKAEGSEVINVIEDSFVAMDTDSVAEENVIPENKDVEPLSLNKRKLSEQEAVMRNEPSKRQHRWKTDTNTVKESQISNAPPDAANDVPKSIIPKRNFSLSNSTDTDNNVKEREVPPSKKVATNSLRIDRFLRPFTLKAVQDLLSKTGTITSFWMDNIKTHCYVTFKSVEEAVETRNTIYNLQWPPNGGHNLVADFVDPEEVRLRVEPPPLPPPPPPPAPMTTAPTAKVSTRPPQQNPMHQRLQQPTLPPPPPPPPLFSNQPPPEKVEGPTLTLDDLFKKTKATPRIYYLPLSEERVAAILEQRKGSKM